MSLQDVARYLADLLAGGAPGAERTLVVCDKKDEAVTAAWTKAVFGPNGTVVTVTKVQDFIAKVTRARTQGSPAATRIVIHPCHSATDPEDGQLKLETGQQGLAELAVLGFKRMEFGGRLKTLLPLLEIGDRWGLNEIVGWTQRFFTATQPFDLKPPRPSTLDQRKAAAADLLQKLSRIPIANGSLAPFSALPQSVDPLAEALKGAGQKIDVPFEWFGGNPNDKFNIANHDFEVGTPRAGVKPQDITFGIARAKIGAVFQEISSPRAESPQDIKDMAKAIAARRDHPEIVAEVVVERMVVTIT